jgi:hypothetical protein
VQEGLSGASMAELGATFGSVTTQADTFNSQMSKAQGALSGQLSKIQSSLKTVQATGVSTATQATGAAAGVYNAVDQLWCLLMMRQADGLSVPNCTSQDMYMTASAINNFIQAYNSSPSEANDPAAYHLYELIMTPENIGTSTNPSYTSLGAICSSSSGLASAAQQLVNSYSAFFQNAAGPDNYTSVMGGISNFLLSASPNFFQMENSLGIAPPACTASSGLYTALVALNTAMTAQTPSVAVIASAIQALDAAFPSTSSSNDGYVNFLQSYMNAPLDANGDSLASLASSSGSNLDSFLQDNGIFSDFNQTVGNYGVSIFGEIANLENPNS